MVEPFFCVKNGKHIPLSSCTQMQPDPRDTVLSLVSIGFAARVRIHGTILNLFPIVIALHIWGS